MSSSLLYMDEQRQDDQLEPMYNDSEAIQDIALKTSWEQWTIEIGALGVMVIVIGNGHGNTSSNPGPG